MKNTILSIAIIASIVPAFAIAQLTNEPQHESLAVTVYNNNLGVVRDVRKFTIPSGASTIKLRDVPSLIDATSVKVTSVEHPKSLEVIEQNYQYDLVSQQKLLEKFIDQSITLIDAKGDNLTGTLLAVEQNRLTLATANGITMLPDIATFRLNVPQLPSSLITRPTLVWTLDADKAMNDESLEVSYETAGMGWHTEYIATLADDDHSLDLSGWISINNRSGASFPNAKLKLVAGNIHQAPRNISGNFVGRQDISMKAMRAPQFEEHGMFEYHVYDLQRPTTLMNNEEKQVSLLTADHVSCDKIYTYRGGTNAEVSIRFENSEKNHLGMPLPMGKVRFMKHDKDKSLQLVGEDAIEHTPRDEKLTLKVGDAFDVKGERVVKDQQTLGSNSSEQTIEITLKNHKDEDITIDVIENLGYNWEIRHNSTNYEKLNANQIVFHVPVKSRGEEKVTYTVLNRW